MRLSNLASVKQGRDESVQDYMKRFRDSKNRCFNLTHSKRDLADLTFKGLRSYIKNKLDNHVFSTLAHLQQRASAQEGRSKDDKEGHRSGRHNLYYVEYDFASSDDDPSKVYAAELVWLPKAKS